MSEPSVCFGCDCVRYAALERKWSPPLSLGEYGSAWRTSVLLTMVKYSLNGSSDLRAVGERSNPFPAAAGDHRFSELPMSLHPAAPCTISIATRRAGSDDARATCRVPNRLAGSMASRYGKATVALRPR